VNGLRKVVRFPSYSGGPLGAVVMSFPSAIQLHRCRFGAEELDLVMVLSG
jgi:hypothetical protein